MDGTTKDQIAKNVNHQPQKTETNERSRNKTLGPLFATQA